jgi:hypothetical protein
MSQTTIIPEFKNGQLLNILNVDNRYEIGAVTEKAIMVKCSDGKWIDNGSFVALWIPKSIINYVEFNDNRDNSQFGMHNITLPTWFINNNSKKF